MHFIPVYMYGYATYTNMCRYVYIYVYMYQLCMYVCMHVWTRI